MSRVNPDFKGYPGKTKKKNDSQESEYSKENKDKNSQSLTASEVFKKRFS